jgi:alpha-tubulin suppressor-like RCC1 family protein
MYRSTILNRLPLFVGLLATLLLLSGCLSSAGSESPTISEDPKDRTVFVGQSAKFDFGASGKPPFTFQWFRNGIAIAGATEAVYITPAVTAADDGAKYSVKITNAQGSITSKDATLTVKAGPSITTEPVAQTVNVGASATFTVAATGEQLQYQWLRDEQPISGATSATYTLSATAAADDGALISVLVGNPGGVISSRAVTLTVLAAPSVTVQPVSQTLVAGDALVLGVTALGGNLRYQWRRNGRDLEGATNRVLRIEAVALADDNASYSVTVTNSLGSVSSNAATLRVVGGAVATLPVAVAQVALAKPGTAAAAFTLVRRSNGSVASWGYNVDGQRGDGTTGVPSDSIGTVTLPAGRTARQVAAGGLQALVLLDNGEVHAWGLNDVGQLGVGDSLSRTAPTKVTLPRAAIAVAAGRQFSLALLDDGRVFAWGANDLGQLGNNTREVSVLPVQVSVLTDVVQIAAGNSHALALRADGSVWAWGANASGQLGDGSFKPSRVPVATGLTQIARIRAGGGVSAAISRRLGLYLWGENADGQLGLGAGAPGDVGVPTALRRDTIDVAAGERGTVVLGSNGLLVASGANDAGSLGDGGTTARNSFAAVSVVSQAIALEMGGLSYAAAIAADGTTWTWGDNASEQLGNSALPVTGTTTPTVVPSFDAVP